VAVTAWRNDTVGAEHWRDRLPT